MDSKITHVFQSGTTEHIIHDFSSDTIIDLFVAEFCQGQGPFYLEDLEKDFNIHFYSRRHGFKYSHGNPLKMVIDSKDFHHVAQEVYWVKDLAIFSLGKGTKQMSFKFYIRCSYLSVLTLDSYNEKVSDCLESSDKVLVGCNIPPYTGRSHRPAKGQYRVVYGHVEDSISKLRSPSCADILLLPLFNSLTDVEDMGFALFFVPQHSSYSDATVVIAAEYIEFPSGIRTADYPLEAMLDDNEEQQRNFECVVETAIASLRGLPNWNSIVYQHYMNLFNMQLFFEPSTHFSEATRRLVINEVVNAVGQFTGRCVEVEKTLWSAPNKGMEHHKEIAGYGPVDFLFNTGKRTILFDDVEMIQCSGLVPPQRGENRGYKLARLDGHMSVSDPEPSPPKPACAPSSESISCGFYTPATLDYTAVRTTLGVSIFDLADQLTHSIIASVMDMNSYEINGLSYQERQQVIEEAKDALTTNGMMQLLLQAHDSLFETKNGKVERVKDHCYGVLTSAQTYHFFLLDWRGGSDKPEVSLLGTLHMPYFIYLSDNRTIGSKSSSSSSKTDGKKRAATNYNRLSYNDFESVVAATVLVALDLLSEPGAEAKIANLVAQQLNNQETTEVDDE